MQHTQLLQQLKTLRVPGMVEALEQQFEQPNTHSDLSFEERLSLMIDREVTHRGNNKVSRLIKAAKIKLLAHPEDVDYAHPRGLDKSSFSSLLSCQWIEHKQNVLLTGSTGCGKTFLGCVLATQACKAGYGVKYFRSSRLLDALSIAHGDGRFAKLINQLAKTDLVVLDDWGLEPLSLSQRNDVLEIMEDRHGVKSTLITSQVPINQWHESIGDPTLADAILDRLLHNAHRINLRGESLRRTQGMKTEPK